MKAYAIVVSFITKHDNAALPRYSSFFQTSFLLHNFRFTDV